VINVQHGGELKKYSDEWVWRLNPAGVTCSELQSWSQVLGQFMADDFTGSLSHNQDRVSSPTPLPPVNVDKNLENKKSLENSFRIATFEELFAS